MKIEINLGKKKNLKKEKLNECKDEDKSKIVSFERKGASGLENNEDENIEKKIVDKEKIKKLMIGGFMLLLCITTLKIRNNNWFKIEEESVLPIIQSTVKTSSSVDENSVDTNEEKVVFAQKKEDKLIFSAPVRGEIQKIYSPDKVVYSKTLRQWKTHDGIDISANEGRDVLSIERGVVHDIYWDNFYGQTIEIEHLLGYVSVYSNLDENVYVKIGESVVKAQKIGKVGNTAVGECSDDSHIHFRLYQNGKLVNPSFVMD